ncbi:MAG: FkbM family methyltransferase [Desulfatitalea sp.]
MFKPMAAKAKNTPSVYPSPLACVHIQTLHGEMLVKLPRNELFRIENIFHRHEYDIPRRFLPSGPLVAVDIGANVGLFALYLRSIRPESTIHCFEPAPNTVELLKSNIGPLTGIHIHPFGLGAKSANVQMTLHPENTGENSIKRMPTHPSQCVDVRVVDAMEAFTAIGLDYIDIMKIDTEGCEVEILRGLQSRLKYFGVILLEYHSDQDRRAVDLLLTGFKVFGAKAATTDIGTIKYINQALL